ncbi:hypothetical protein PZA11_001199 [Diplocarpon coronariae]
MSQKTTHAIKNSRHEVNRMRADGDTALWDAVALANVQLVEYGRKFPDAQKRIICLSDGEDKTSSQRVAALCTSLLENHVIVDSICLGNEDNQDLRTVSYLTGGYKFQPESSEQAMAILEVEPVLSQLERPPIVVPTHSQSHPYDANLRFLFTRDEASPEVVAADIFPRGKELANIHDYFVQISSMSTTPQPAPVNTRTSRILTEIRSVAANPHP